MSEAELITAFHEFLASIHTLLFGFMSLLSGFLIMSYIVARQIPTFLSNIVLTLYATFSLTLIFKIYLLRNDFASLAAYIRNEQAAGAVELAWFGVAPGWAPSLVAFLEVSTLFLGFVGSIAFYVYQRRRGVNEA